MSNAKSASFPLERLSLALTEMFCLFWNISIINLYIFSFFVNVCCFQSCVRSPAVLSSVCWESGFMCEDVLLAGYILLSKTERLPDLSPFLIFV